MGDFEQLYRRYFSWVCVFFRRQGFGWEEARDLAQETFVRVYRSMDRYQGGSPKAFLATTARRVGYNRIRDSKAAFRSADETSLDALVVEPASASKNVFSDEAPPSQEDRLLAREEERARYRRLAEGIEGLTPAVRLALTLRLEGASYAEIGETLGITMDAVKSRIHSAKKKLNRQVSVSLEASKDPNRGRGG